MTAATDGWPGDGDRVFATKIEEIFAGYHGNISMSCPVNCPCKPKFQREAFTDWRVD